MREQILNDLKEAMKNQEKAKLSVIRMVKGAIQMEELNLIKRMGGINFIQRYLLPVGVEAFIVRQDTLSQ